MALLTGSVIHVTSIDGDFLHQVCLAWFSWHSINYSGSHHRVTCRRSSSWKPVIVMLSLTRRFSSSVGQLAALTKDNGDGKHGRFRRPQVCQELVPAVPWWTRKHSGLSKSSCALIELHFRLSIALLQSGWIVRAPG